MCMSAFVSLCLSPVARCTHVSQMCLRFLFACDNNGYIMYVICTMHICCHKEIICGKKTHFPYSLYVCTVQAMYRYVDFRSEILISFLLPPLSPYQHPSPFHVSTIVAFIRSVYIPYLLRKE